MAVSAVKHPTTVAVDSKGNWLQAVAGGSYLRLLAAGMATGGVDVFQRTLEMQKRLYEKYLAGGPLAARPSPTAPHVLGVAMDFQTTRLGIYMPSAAFKWATVGGIGKNKPAAGEHLRINDYGWFRDVPSERWHMRYYPDRDKFRKADLMRRVQVLGYATVKQFQAAHGLIDDGVDGPLTWGALLNNPTPKGLPVTPDVQLRVGSFNVQAKRFGGGLYSTDGKFIDEVLNPSVLFTVETDEAARTQILADTALDKVYPLNYLGLYWVSSKWIHGPRLVLTFDNKGVQGAVATKLTSAVNGESFMGCAVHIRPNDAFSGTDAEKLNGKKRDIAKVIAFLSPYPNVIVGGDFNTAHAVELFKAAGYRHVTPDVDTHDSLGIQRLDGIYIKGRIDDRTGGSIHKTGASDHHGLVANLTLLAPVATN